MDVNLWYTYYVLLVYVEMDRNKDDREDEDLATALKRGDQQAFDVLVARHQGRVYAAAYRLTQNREDALDVAQDAFLKAYRKIDSWQPTGGFLPWLLRLTTNQAIDWLRQHRRHRHEPLEAWHAPETHASATEVRAREIDERIRASLVVLSTTQRTVFALRHYEGLPLSDIADQLGCTVGSVKVHLFRAMKKLQKELGDLT